jgi:hypothetical protein
MRLTRLAIAVCVLTLFTMAMPASAQTAPPAAAPARVKPDARNPVFAIDARGVFGRLGQDTTTATGLSTTQFHLPATGLGAAGGAQVYLWRGRSMAFGIGGEAMFARAHRVLVDSDGKATSTAIDRRLESASAQLHLNFGHRDGWSYLTAGIGPTSFDSYFAGAVPDGLRETSINFGGGARWFNWEHLAFTADLRFYGTKPALATANTAPRVRKNLVVFSGGISIK